MTNAGSYLRSSIGKKLINGLTGVGLVLFIIMHLAGNLTLFGGKDAFNAYAYTLHSFGALVYVAEVGLILLFLVHAASAVRVWLDKREARSVQNKVVQSKGAPSRQTLASRSMIVTGTVLLAFTIAHVWQFRLGPAEPQGYVTMLHGEEVRDLHRLVIETFQSLPFVAAYVAVMMLLGLHLRHGVWSAFQSLGLLNPALRSLAYSAALVVGVAIAVGFLVLPVWIYLFVPEPGSTVAMVSRP